jgi:hypothetical protein
MDRASLRGMGKWDILMMKWNRNRGFCALQQDSGADHVRSGRTRFRQLSGGSVTSCNPEWGTTIPCKPAMKPMSGIQHLCPAVCKFAPIWQVRSCDDYKGLQPGACRSSALYPANFRFVKTIIKSIMLEFRYI